MALTAYLRLAGQKQVPITGIDQHYYSVQLTNAAISSILVSLMDHRDPALDPQKAYEEVAFTYEKIVWTWVNGHSAEDNWNH